MGNYNAEQPPDRNRIRQVAFGYLFAPEDQLKVDQFGTDSDLKVYALVKKIGSTRLHVLVDPNDLPH